MEDCHLNTVVQVEQYGCPELWNRHATVNEQTEKLLIGTEDFSQNCDETVESQKSNLTKVFKCYCHLEGYQLCLSHYDN